MLSQETERKLNHLRDSLGELGSVLIAYSGGVDSAFLAHVAFDVLGVRAAAGIAKSPSLPGSELAEARRLAGRIGIRLLEVDTRELDDPRYAANPANRCYFCKVELFRRLRPVAKGEGLTHIAYGAIVDDLSDHRPGHSAALEFGIRSPLQEAGLEKADIRALSEAFGLPTWDKPAMACLASRIPHGQRVTVEKLRVVEKAEAHLRGLGFRQLRVRHHGGLARIEVGEDEVRRFFQSDLMDEIGHAFLRLGFPRVSVDLGGYRTGSLNPQWVPLPVMPSFAPTNGH